MKSHRRWIKLGPSDPNKEEEMDEVRIQVRLTTYEDCLVLGDTVLIGQTALESTDLFVDGLNHRLVPNPAHPNAIVSPVR
jgi:hypothetical protein